MPHQLAVVTASQVELSASTYAAHVDDQPVTVYRQADGSLVLPVPDVAAGRHTLSLTTAAGTLTTDFTVTAAPAIDAPAAFLDELERSLNAQIDAALEATTGTVDETARRADLQAARTRLSDQLQAISGLSAADQRKLAQVINVNVLLPLSLAESGVASTTKHATWNITGEGYDPTRCTASMRLYVMAVTRSVRLSAAVVPMIGLTYLSWESGVSPLAMGLMWGVYAIKVHAATVAMDRVMDECVTKGADETLASMTAAPQPRSHVLASRSSTSAQVLAASSGTPLFIDGVAQRFDIVTTFRRDDATLLATSARLAVALRSVLDLLPSSWRPASWEPYATPVTQDSATVFSDPSTYSLVGVSDANVSGSAMVSDGALQLTFQTRTFSAQDTAFTFQLRDSRDGRVTTHPATLKAQSMSLTLTPSELPLSIGASGHLNVVASLADGTVMATPTGLVWHSSATDVATVSDTGQIQAVAPGTATITVTDPATGVEAPAATVRVTAATATYRLVGKPTPNFAWTYPTDYGNVDDDVAIYLNGVALYVESNGVANSFAPIAFSARPGDRLRITAIDRAGICHMLSPLAIRLPDGSEVLLTSGVQEVCDGAAGSSTPFFDQTFIVP